MRAAVARSAFKSQNVKSTKCSDHFWRWGCRKSAPGCRALLEVEMWEKCMPLWCETPFQVKMLRTHVRTAFGCSTTSRHSGISRTQLPKCSNKEVFLTCQFQNKVQNVLPHVLRATAACHFSSPIRPDGFASGAPKHLNTTVLRDFSTFSRTCIFFLLTLSLILFLPFSSLTLLNLLTSAIPSVHSVGRSKHHLHANKN